MSGVDPFELLRRRDPVPDPMGLEAPESVVDRVLAGAPRRRRGVGRAGRLVAVAAVGAAAAAAAFAVTRQPTQTTTVGCYAAAAPDADVAVVGLDGRTPTEACAAVWEEGAIGSGPTPPLQTCTLPSGGIGVVPGGTPAVCRRLGPNAAAASSPSTTGEVAALQQALAAAGRAAPCVSPDDARVTARQELDRRGMQDWRVEDGEGVAGGGFDDARPCAGFAVDEPERTVVLVPMPAR